MQAKCFIWSLSKDVVIRSSDRGKKLAYLDLLKDDMVYPQTMDAVLLESI